ncbi:MAG: hypothetical protein JW719_08235 [Pirellulales bacterium]|nr:hypothetical protein [Pirellulales bacterium]
MPQSTRVVVFISSMQGYDRGILRGIARYSRLHGPWFFDVSGVQAEIPIPHQEDLGSLSYASRVFRREVGATIWSYRRRPRCSTEAILGRP